MFSTARNDELVALMMCQCNVLDYLIKKCNCTQYGHVYNHIVFTAGPHCLQCNRCICYGRVCPSVLHHIPVFCRDE